MIRKILQASLAEERPQYRWGALLARFTGARLEEIAQLEIDDVREIEGVWCIDINNKGTKKLKNKASARLVPLHSRLIDLGFIKYVEAAKAAGHGRVLHQLSHTGQNGYGRNLSRWFNETLLPMLGIKRDGLTFHSLRHSFATEMQQAGVEDSLIKRLIGHAQTDTLNRVYAKGQIAGQFRTAIEQLAPLI